MTAPDPGSGLGITVGGEPLSPAGTYCGDDDLAGVAPTERAPAPPFPLHAAAAALTELALRAGIAVAS